MRQSREGGTTPGETEVALSPVVEVRRTYLELRAPEQLRPSDTIDPTVRFVHRRAITADEYRRLYHDVGHEWHWIDRSSWSDERLAAHLARADISVFECLVNGESAGFFELERHDDDRSVEIAYFGLEPRFIGRGLGKSMLTEAARQAWSHQPRRVWLHTCTLDSPHALPNYLARGFEPVRSQTFVLQLP